ncbi:MAG: CDP-alcohol phosphatidyltransferase family protein [Ferruginibacter sp.]
MKTAKHKRAWYIINGITVYRIIAAPFLLILLFTGKVDIFKWLLALSFFTDLIDGFLARKFKVTSVLGTRLDSIGDDLTVLVAMIGLFVLKTGFVIQHKLILILLLVLFMVQVGYAFIRYRKMTGFHTWLAKTAAFLQGIFLLLVFFTHEPSVLLFYVAAIITMLQLIEEIILVHLLPQWQMNVKGLYWVLKNNNQH